MKSCVLVARLAIGVLEGELEVLDVRGAVVAERTGDFLVLVDLVVDLDARRRRDVAGLEAVALRALVLRHRERDFALGVERQLVAVGHRLQPARPAPRPCG